MSITDFLNARIAEDEREANACLEQYRRGEGGSKRRWVRQLAECAAKRAIVGMHRSKSYSIPTRQNDDGMEYWHSHGEFIEVRKAGHFVEHITSAEYLERVGATLNPPAKELLALAAVYADHPDYSSEWKVGA